MSTITERTAAPATRRWVVDPDRSTVEFEARHVWGLKTAVGGFSRFAGAYRIGPGGPGIELTVEADSIDTGNRRRDEHLRSADFFHVDAHPHVRFTSTDVTETAGGRLRVAGELEAGGSRVPLAFDATIRELGDELEVAATTTVDQRRLEMTASPLGMLRAPVTVHARARLEPARSTS